MENVSNLAKNALEMLLSVYALACMARGSGNMEHLKAAGDWLPMIEGELRMLRKEIEECTAEITT